VGSFSHLCCWTNYPSQKCAVPLNQITTRQLHSMCTWCLRGQYKSGDGCDYAGQNGYFDKQGNPVDDPSLDKCSGLLKTGCVPRFGKNNPLPFGGFVGTSLLRK
ncbi:hypothetical protein AB7X12_06465, partial [Proteus terrae]